MPHTLLRSNAYMQNVLASAPEIAKTSGFGSAAGKGRTGMVDARDVAAVAAKIAATPLRTPKDLLALRPAADLQRRCGRRALQDAGPDRHLPGTQLRGEQGRDDQSGGPEQIAHMNAQALSLTAEGDAEWVTQDVPTLLGRPARSFEQFAADHAASFA